VARCGDVNAADARRVAFNPIDKSENVVALDDKIHSP
jgi:hypothetical protein